MSRRIAVESDNIIEKLQSYNLSFKSLDENQGEVDLKTEVFAFDGKKLEKGNAGLESFQKDIKKFNELKSCFNESAPRSITVRNLKDFASYLNSPSKNDRQGTLEWARDRELRMAEAAARRGDWTATHHGIGQSGKYNLALAKEYVPEKKQGEFLQAHQAKGQAVRERLIQTFTSQINEACGKNPKVNLEALAKVIANIEDYRDKGVLQSGNLRNLREALVVAKNLIEKVPGRKAPGTDLAAVRDNLDRILDTIKAPPPPPLKPDFVARETTD